MKKDSFVFYRSFYESMKELDNKSKLEIYEAIAEYSLNQNITELSGISKAIFILIKPQIDANFVRYENGKKGGRPKEEETKTKPKRNQNETKTKPKRNLMIMLMIMLMIIIKKYIKKNILIMKN